MATECAKNPPNRRASSSWMTTPASAACWIRFCAARNSRPCWRIPARHALETLRAGKFDMMISDVRMPGLTGLETLRLARKEHATLPVLLVTAFTDVRDAVAAMRDGAVNYLSKPIDLDELLAIRPRRPSAFRKPPRCFTTPRKNCRIMSSPAARSCRPFSTTHR